MFDQSVAIDKVLAGCRERDDSAFAELVRRYTPLIKKLISEFEIDFLEESELFSEGCAALYHAALAYNLSQREVTFGLYARVCIHHRFVDITRRHKSVPELLDYNVETVKGSDSFEAEVFARERIDSIISYAKSALSDYEYSVLILHIQGYKTAAIAERLGKTPKSVDNAKARLFRRLREVADSI